MGSHESAPIEFPPEMVQEREMILNMEVKKLSVIIQPSNTFVKYYQKAVSGFSFILPADLSCANRSHTGIFIFVDDSYNGIYMEFGPYEYSKEQNTNSHIHYLQGSDGMHFFLANYSDIDGYKIDCTVEYRMTIRNLFNSLSYQGWTKADYEEVNYDPITQMFDSDKDSKDFARKVIKILGAKRIKKYDRIRTYCKGYVPCDIINILEENEECINFEERIPFIGTVVGLVKMAVTDD